MTDRELGHGSYATVQELEYMGLKCAGKKIHDLLLRQGDASYTLRRFEEECRLLSQARHPNIVQFLGVHFQSGERVPILVMEYLPTNLTSCIEQHGILTKEIGYSILDDVALGLYYLHSQTPPIIHRDLSSNNVLLTANMTAKISDLGVARILNLTPLQVSRLTNTPGTPAFMPPEVMAANSEYNASIDIFSYGILMIHMFSGRWPEPQVGQTRMEEGRLIPVTEAERRDVFLHAIGNSHPLMDLMSQCVDNDPKQRPSTSEVLRRTAEMKLQFPPPFCNTLEMLNKIGNQEKEKGVLKEEAQRNDREKERRMAIMTNEAKQKDDELNRQELAFSHEVRTLQLQIRDLRTRMELLQADSFAKVAELEIKATHNEELRRQGERFMLQVKTLTSEKYELQCKLAQSGKESEFLQSEIATLKEDVKAKITAMEVKSKNLDSKIKALQEKDALILDMQLQLTKAKEYLFDRQQVCTCSGSNGIPFLLK